MSEERTMLAETAGRLFGEAFARSEPFHASGVFDAALWRAVDELGLAQLLVPESAGGAGGGFEDALVLTRALGRYAAAVPLAETLLAARVLAEAGLAAPPGPLSLALRGGGALAGDRFSGTLEGVPWGADASGVVSFVASGHLVLLSPAVAAETTRGANLADEARDRLRFDAAPAIHAAVPEGAAARVLDHAVLLRCGQVAGALAATLERSLAYASQRMQFGKTLAQFQAVQQLLAVMGEEVMAAECAVTAASRAADRGEAGFEIACARLRTSQSSDTCAAGAHQVHGAIGFTHEQDLRLFTQRLLAWRGELGSERAWAERLGAAVAARGAGAFWPDLTARS